MSSRWSSTAGLRLWSSVDHLRDDFGLKASRDASGVGRARRHDRSFPSAVKAAASATGSIRGLKVLGVDIAGKITDFVGDKIEGQLAPGPGLYRCSPTRTRDLSAPREADRQTADAGVPARHRIVHATAASANCGTAPAHASATSPISTARTSWRCSTGRSRRARSRTRATSSPALAKVAARGAPSCTSCRIHAAVWSASSSRAATASAAVRSTRPTCRSSSDNGRAADRTALKELRDLLDKQRYVVSRFVRVACPSPRHDARRAAGSTDICR